MPTDVTGREHVTPVKIKSTSATERATFRKCRRRWLLTIVHRLTSVEGNQNLWLGTLVHAGLEAYYKEVLVHQEHDRACPRAARFDVVKASQGEDPWLGCEHTYRDPAEVALDVYQEEYERSLVPLEEALEFLWPNVEPTYRELGELGFDMLVAYFQREVSEPVVDEIVEVEKRITIPIYNPAGKKVGELSVKTDLVGRRAGRLAVVDHKTASREASASQLDLDDQLSAEVFAVWTDRDEFPDEAIYNVLMKKAPKPPKLLKPKRDGTPKLSKDKDQGTTYDLYLAEIKRLGLDAAEYADILEHFHTLERSGESQFFKRDYTIRTPDQMASFEENLYQEWRDMTLVAAEPERAYPNPSPFNCPSCPVKLVCVTMMDRGDVESIIKASYVVGDPRR